MKFNFGEPGTNGPAEKKRAGACEKSDLIRFSAKKPPGITGRLFV